MTTETQKIINIEYQTKISRQKGKLFIQIAFPSLSFLGGQFQTPF